MLLFISFTLILKLFRLHKICVILTYLLCFWLLWENGGNVFIASHCFVESKQDLCWFPFHCVKLGGWGFSLRLIQHRWKDLFHFITIKNKHLLIAGWKHTIIWLMMLWPASSSICNHVRSSTIHASPKDIMVVIFLFDNNQKAKRELICLYVLLLYLRLMYVVYTRTFDLFTDFYRRTQTFKILSSSSDSSEF